MAIEAIVTGVAVARADPMEDRQSGVVDKSAFGKAASSRDPRLSEAEGEDRWGWEGVEWECGEARCRDGDCTGALWDLCGGWSCF